MNLKIRLILALLAIIMSNAMVSAKLTVGYVYLLDDSDAITRFAAQIRQSIVEIYGEEWFKSYVLKRGITNSPYFIAYFGDDKELILNGRLNCDDEDIFIVKEAIDHLAVKGDTLCFVLVNKFEKPHTYDLHDVMEHLGERKLFVGNFYEKDLDMVYAPIVFDLDNLKLERAYKHALESGEWFAEKVGNQTDGKIDEKFVDAYFDALMESDRKFLSKPRNSTPIILDNSYEYDENAGIRLSYEKEIRRNNLPRRINNTLTPEPLDLPVEEMVDEMLSGE